MQLAKCKRQKYNMEWVIYVKYSSVLQLPTIPLVKYTRERTLLSHAMADGFTHAHFIQRRTTTTPHHKSEGCNSIWEMCHYKDETIIVLLSFVFKGNWKLLISFLVQSICSCSITLAKSHHQKGYNFAFKFLWFCPFLSSSLRESWFFFPFLLSV